jgi:hypothetical protein
MNIASFIISVFAFAISTYSVFVSRKNSMLTQEPHLVGHENEGDTEYSYIIINKGGGCAFFKKVEYFMNLKPIESNEFKKSIKDMLKTHGIRFRSSILSIGDENIMASGESYTLVGLEINKEDAEKMANIDDSVFGIRITYASSHGKEKVWSNDERLKKI